MDSGAPSRRTPHLQISPDKLRRVGAAAEAEDEDLVAVVEILNEPRVGFDDLVVDAPPRNTSARGLAALGTDALRVVDALIGDLARQGFQPPYVRVVVQRIPGAVQKDRKSSHGCLRTVADRGRAVPS